MVHVLQQAAGQRLVILSMSSTHLLGPHAGSCLSSLPRSLCYAFWGHNSPLRLRMSQRLRQAVNHLLMHVVELSGNRARYCADLFEGE